MSIWPFQRSRASTDAARLLAAVQTASRRPALFGDSRIADTLEGRFELMALNAALALIRLRAEPDAGPLAQDFTDRLFRHFDAGLRESGVGDLSVPKRMRKLASSFYGRLDAYASVLDDPPALATAIGRNVLGAEDHPFASTLAQFAADAARTQAAAALEVLFGPAGWPQPQA